MQSEQAPNIQVKPVDKAKVNKLVRTAVILGVVTFMEFAVAFTIPYEMAALRVWIFIGMTIVKAFYIVAEFMHLKYEVKVLIWSIMIPMIFVVWMLVAFIYEGSSIFDVRQ